MIWQPIDMATIGILRIYRSGLMILKDTEEATYTAALPGWLPSHRQEVHSVETTL